MWTVKVQNLLPGTRRFSRAGDIGVNLLLCKEVAVECVTSSHQMLCPVSLISPACQAANRGRQRADIQVRLNTLLLYLHTKIGVKTLSQDPHDSVSSSVAGRGFVRPDYKLLPRTNTNHLPEKTIIAEQLLSIGLHSRIKQLSGDICYPQPVIWFHTGVCW